MRSVSSSLDEIREFFGTTDPEKIKEMFEERRRTSQTFRSQIEDLDQTCKELEVEHSRVRAAFEEVAFTSTKSLGANRLILEGRQLLEQKKQELMISQRKIVSIDANYKSISSGVLHLTEVLALLLLEDVPPEPITVLQWTKVKVDLMRTAFQSELTDYLAMCNQAVLADIVARASASDYDLEHVDSTKRNVKRQVEPSKRAAKDPKHEVLSRVMTRQEIKDFARKAEEEKTGKKKVSQTP